MPSRLPPRRVFIMLLPQTQSQTQLKWPLEKALKTECRVKKKKEHQRSPHNNSKCKKFKYLTHKKKNLHYTIDHLQIVNKMCEFQIKLKIIFIAKLTEGDGIHVYRTVFGLFICSRGNMENCNPLALPNRVIVCPIWYSAGPGPIFLTDGRTGLRPNEYCGPRGIRVSHFSNPNVLGNVYAAGPGPD